VSECPPQRAGLDKSARGEAAAGRRSPAGLPGPIEAASVSVLWQTQSKRSQERGFFFSSTVAAQFEPP